jgi:hypothetical protein
MRVNKLGSLYGKLESDRCVHVMYIFFRMFVQAGRGTSQQSKSYMEKHKV